MSFDMIQLKQSLILLSAFGVLSHDKLSLAIFLDNNDCVGHNERQIHHEMDDHEKDCSVADIELDLGVVDPGREAEHSVEHQKQDDLVEVLQLHLRTILVNVAADYDDLDYDLRRHQIDLPDKCRANTAYCNHKQQSSEQEETWLVQDFLSS